MAKRLRSAAVFLLGILALAPLHLGAQALERSIFVSVVDDSGAPVADVGPRDLVVREDGTAREILRVEPATEPMLIALLVDNSQAGEPYIRDYREALPAFLETIAADADVQGRHQIALIALASRPTILVDYTMDTDRLRQGIGRVFSQSDSGTYLLDAIMEVSSGIAKRESARPVIVAVTTEGPELSDRVYQQVLEPLLESGAALHVMVVGSPRNNAVDRGVVLTRGPEQTGGTYETVLASSALAGRMKQLAAQLTSQYRVTYARPETLIPPERVTVSASRPGLTARGTAAVEPRKQGRP